MHVNLRFLGALNLPKLFINRKDTLLKHQILRLQLRQVNRQWRQHCTHLQRELEHLDQPLKVSTLQHITSSQLLHPGGLQLQRFSQTMCVEETD